MNKIKTFFAILFFIWVSLSVNAETKSTTATSSAEDFNIIDFEKPTIKVKIFTSAATCWNCIDTKTLEKIRDLKLNNSNLDFEMFYCAKIRNKNYLTEFKKENKLNFDFVYDPDALYPAKYNIKIFPAIVIENEKGEVVVKEEFKDLNKYISTIKKIDENIHIEEFKDKLEGLKFSKKIILHNRDGSVYDAPIYYAIRFSSETNKYIIGSISIEDGQFFIFDSTGTFEKVVPAVYEKINRIYENAGDIKIINDSIIIWTIMVKGEKSFERDFIKMKTNTEEILKHKKYIDSIAKNITSSQSSLSGEYILLKSGKLILRHYPFDNIYLDSNFKLLAITDTNFNVIKFFGISDTICKNNRLSRIMDRTSIAEYNSDIYFIQNNSHILHKYDSNGNFVKDINLDFNKIYQIRTKELSAEFNKEEIINYNKNACNIAYTSLNISNNIISVYYYKKEGENQNPTHYIDRFDMAGKRISETAQIEDKNGMICYLDDKRVLFVNWENKVVTFIWYVFD